MYDIIYIGGGLNYAGAIVAAKQGKKVALVEADLSQLGGVCLHKGCIPSKMFLHHANTVFESRNEVLKGTLLLDVAKLTEKKTALLESVGKIVQKQCESAGVELVEAKGTVVAPGKVQAGSEMLEAAAVVMGTGSSPVIPEGIDYDGKRVITSDEVLELTALPEKIAVYGTGAIGLEMASFFAASGVEVMLIGRDDAFPKGAHVSVQQAMKTQLEKLGITPVTGSIVSAKSTDKRGVHIVMEDKREHYVPMLLVATGRRPNTGVAGCKEIAVERGIVTDGWFETTLKGHYAIGDCNGKLQLAHAARAQALNVTDRLLGNAPRMLNLSHVVKFIHTLPMSYAYVGKRRSELDAEGIRYREKAVPLNQFTYAVYNHATKGMMISYVDAQGFILGAEILAPNAEELISAVAMALAGEMDAAQANRTILAHPTFSEALERTFYRL
jgi:dihydrolipoamide dehydrogenase